MNYDDISLFVRVAQIVSMHGHAMSYFNWDWIAPCISTITSPWLVDAIVAISVQAEFPR